MSASRSPCDTPEPNIKEALEDTLNASVCSEIAIEYREKARDSASTYREGGSYSSSASNVSEISHSFQSDTDGEVCGSDSSELKRSKDSLLDNGVEKETSGGSSPDHDLGHVVDLQKNSLSYMNDVSETCLSTTEDPPFEPAPESQPQLVSSKECHNSQLYNGLSTSLLNHPAYKTVIQELTHFKENMNILQSEISRLEGENQRLEADRSHEIYVVQLETLEKTIAQQQKEIQSLKTNNEEQLQAATKSYNQMKEELEGKLQRLTKQNEVAESDRETMVMRYVVSEKQVIDLRKMLENNEKKLKESNKERELLVGKLKSSTSEKQRVCQMLDTKCHELTSIQKENERMKDDLNSREIKVKWLQNKLKSEMDLNKENQVRIDKLVQKVQECREETEQVRRDCQETMRSFQESEDNKAHALGIQLKEHQAKLIMERHEREGKEENYKQLLQEIDNIKKKNQLIIEENNILSVKVQNLEKERLEYEQNLSKFKWATDKQRQDIVDLQNQVAEMEALRMQLQHVQEKVISSQAEVERLRDSNEEMLQEMAVCREREAELLDFTQKLTEKNVRLQSEFSSTEAKAQMLEYKQGPMQRQLTELESKVASLQADLNKEQQLRAEENALLARHLAERTKLAEDLTRQVEDLQGEIQVLRRKNQATVKELARELQHYRRKEMASEISSCSNSLGHASRTSSCSSLNTVADGNNGNGGRKSPGEQNVLSDNTNTQAHMNSLELDHNMLIERIVKLQKSNARKQEKLDFMEGHSKQLVTELQKKTRIVQHYIMREQAGALSPDSMDQNKAEVMKHGGIMASLYGSKTIDNTMTLELSLEINKKLQAVLEDTLLKNITLKENIDTLGSEIARLTIQKSKQEIHR